MLNHHLVESYHNGYYDQDYLDRGMCNRNIHNSTHRECHNTHPYTSIQCWSKLHSCNYNPADYLCYMRLLSNMKSYKLCNIRRYCMRIRFPDSHRNSRPLHLG